MRATEGHWEQRYDMKEAHLQPGLCRAPLKTFLDEGVSCFLSRASWPRHFTNSVQDICCIPRVFKKTACKSLQRCPYLDRRNRGLFRFKFSAPSAIVGFWIFFFFFWTHMLTAQSQVTITEICWKCGHAGPYGGYLGPWGMNLMETVMALPLPLFLHPGMSFVVLMPLRRCKTRSVSQKSQNCKQNIPFVFVSCLSQIFCCSNWKLSTIPIKWLMFSLQ